MHQDLPLHHAAGGDDMQAIHQARHPVVRLGGVEDIRLPDLDVPDDGPAEGVDRRRDQGPDEGGVARQLTMGGVGVGQAVLGPQRGGQNQREAEREGTVRQRELRGCGGESYTGPRERRKGVAGRFGPRYFRPVIVSETVALFNTNFLPFSQTFVYEEIRQHTRYGVEVFCRHRELAERFPFSPVHVGGPLYGVTCRSSAFDARFRASRFSVVHAHFGLGAVYARPFARRHRLPLLVTFHGYDVPLLSSPKRWLPQHLRYAVQGPRVLRDMTLGLCASTELKLMLERLGVPSDRLRVHRLGIDLQQFVPGTRRSDRCEVVMIGRFVAKKGFEYGLAAYAEVAREESSLHLTLVGDGDRGPALRRLAASLGVADRVSFTGPLAPDRVAALLAESHILLAPSVVDRDGNRESGLIVAKEASACGTVPIGTMHGGIPDIIDDGSTGYLVPERDSAALADRLRRLVRDPALRDRLGVNAQEKMRREYDNVARVRALELLYDEAQLLYRERS